MGKGEIGFIHGVPENPQTKWEKKLRDTTVIYTKTRVEGGFIYDCERLRADSSSKTSWQTHRNLTGDEVEQLPRFVDFLNGKI